jgi:hypothetical protein
MDAVPSMKCGRVEPGIGRRATWGLGLPPEQPSHYGAEELLPWSAGRYRARPLSQGGLEPGEHDSLLTRFVS